MINPWPAIERHLNFFRVHLLFFTFTPLVFSVIFYAANGENHIPYIDALFSCFSVGVVCGLLTIDLSALTGFQQAILFVQAAIGNPVVVSWVMVYIRKRYFNKRLKYIVKAEIAKREALNVEREITGHVSEGRMLRRRFMRTLTMHGSAKRPEDEQRLEEKKRTMLSDVRTRKTNGDLRPGVIQRADEEPKRVDPSGEVSHQPQLNVDNNNHRHTHLVGFEMPVQGSSSRRPYVGQSSAEDDYFGHRPESSMATNTCRPYTEIVHDDRTYIPPGGAPLRRRTTLYTQRSQMNVPSNLEPPSAINTGYGGFPYPQDLILQLAKKIMLNILHRLGRSTTLLQSRVNDNTDAIQYFSDSFHALIGRNSKFYSLTEENMEELGGVEYRALNALLWIIGIYHFTIHILSFIIIAPYMSIPRWKADFEPPNLHRPVSPVWFSSFQVVSAYSAAGISLVDQSLVPFQEAYPLLFICTFLILAGNLAFPIFLRFFIWTIMKLVPGTRLSETLHFLLDHPRRCYIYLFPAPQTWVLLGVVIGLNALDIFLLLVLNIGEPAIEAIPVGVRFVIGIFQSTSVRIAGFSALPVSSLAPALQFSYVILMYLGVYPIALSVKSTNVYEEKSLGVFDEDEEDDLEPTVEDNGISSYWRYVAFHARKQLAFDMWWLALALFILCVIERSKIQEQENFQWFSIFTVLFELISAYSGVGMSLGVPNKNFSFSGALTPTSKLIIIAVMLRGRHRGLPVAIDRAVMLPFEFERDDPTEETSEGGGRNSGVIKNLVSKDAEKHQT